MTTTTVNVKKHSLLYVKYRVFATIFNRFAVDKCFSVSIQGYYLVFLRGTTLHVSQRAPVFHCYKTIIELYVYTIVTSTYTRFTCRISFIVCYCFQYDYEDNYNTHLRGECETLSD